MAFGVGAQGTIGTSMQPELLAKMLAMRYQKQREDQAAAMAMDIQRRKQQQDAMKFAMERQDKANEAARQDKWRKASLESRGANAVLQAKAKLAVEEARQAAIAAKKKQLADWVLGHPNMQSPGYDTFQGDAPGLAQQAQQMSQQAMMNPDPAMRNTMLGLGTGAVAAQAKAGFAPAPNVAVLDPREEEILRQANAQVPEGWMKRQDYEDMKRAHDKANGIDATAKAKKAKDDALEQARLQAESTAAALLGADATDEEKHRFVLAMQDPQARKSPWRVAETIRKDRATASKAGGTTAAKTATKEEKIDDKMDDLKRRSDKAQMIANDDLTDETKKKAAQMDADFYQKEIQKLDGRKAALTPKASTQQKAVEGAATDEANSLKSEYEAAKASGDPARIKNAEEEIKAFQNLMQGGSGNDTLSADAGNAGQGQEGGDAGPSPEPPHGDGNPYDPGTQWSEYDKWESEHGKGRNMTFDTVEGGGGDDKFTITPSAAKPMSMELRRLRMRKESPEQFKQSERLVSAGALSRQTPEQRDQAIKNKQQAVILDLIREEVMRGNIAYDRGDLKAWRESKKKAKELQDHFDKVSGG